ncbi:hypothetical protein BaRGS_00031957 [Batillaria attramentaria]|uniref:Uncharacterized protein n=1 Tax=Batillaria attramentaria TaxID=370345 RepID=A0ABD0JP55_9CAEN
MVVRLGLLKPFPARCRVTLGALDPSHPTRCSRRSRSKVFCDAELRAGNNMLWEFACSDEKHGCQEEKGQSTLTESQQREGRWSQYTHIRDTTIYNISYTYKEE